MKQEHRINELKIELMKAIVGYVKTNIYSLISIFSGMLQWLLQICQLQCRINGQGQMLHQDNQ